MGELEQHHLAHRDPPVVAVGHLLPHIPPLPHIPRNIVFHVGILLLNIFHSWNRLPLPSVILRPKIAFPIFYFSSKVYVLP